MDKIVEAIRDANRREILLLLNLGELEVGEIVKKMNISQPQVSMILKEFRDMKLVDCRVLGKKRIYKIRKEVMESLIKEINEFLKMFGQNYENEIIVRR